ncbi:hypothetical protein H3C61_00920 [Candidatus Gracilibacteria bacterium]|nr:hypothetical protein [Candidatus Gracilibacteria bacterium]
MIDPKTLLDENLALKKENQILKTKLNIVQVWMKKEVKEQTLKIAKQKTSKLAIETREDFLQENFEEVLANKINDYFGDLLLLNAPKGTIEGITGAEINYYNMLKNPSIDGFAVISAYHKVLDLFIESFVTNNFRKFAKKKGCTILRVNDPLEKSLNLIVNSKYILSVGRLFGLLRMIKEDQKLYDYGKCFKEYLDKYSELKEILLEDDFYDKFSRLNKSEVLASKRHSGTISKKDTTDARKILIGELRNKKSIIYRLLEGQSVLI